MFWLASLKTADFDQRRQDLLSQNEISTEALLPEPGIDTKF